MDGKKVDMEIVVLWGRNRGLIAGQERPGDHSHRSYVPLRVELDQNGVLSPQRGLVSSLGRLKAGGHGDEVGMLCYILHAHPQLCPYHSELTSRYR